MYRNVYPLAAIVGQESLKQSLLIGAVNPAVGGVLIRGEKGTAKSTAVRALADLLPEKEVILGCPFGCNPKTFDHLCPECRQNYPHWVTDMRRVRVVTLPLNATEDRVAGGIDFSLAVKKGERLLSPGLLADAHGGILYVDEVNLLDDHIVDIILDAAASGENRIEREGISFSHPSHFMLVGTMNPEEGELRPQLLDRFGLCVEVNGADDPEDRVALMELRDTFDQDPVAFHERYRSQSEQLASQIKEAQKFLKRVRMPKHLRNFITALCTENNVAGHRADLVMEQAAKALAALEMKSEVTVDHVSRVAPMVLIHRQREAQPPPPPPPPPPEDPQSEEDQDQDTQNQEEEDDPSQDENTPEENKDDDNRDSGENENQNDDESQQEGRPEEASAESNPMDEASPENEDGQDSSEKNRPELQQSEDEIFQIGATFKVKPLSVDKDRVVRRGSGRRSRSRVSQKQGRYVKSCMQSHHGDIAFDATLRAAAPYQKQRRINGCDKNGGNNGATGKINNGANGKGGKNDAAANLCVHLTPQDIRGKVREKRIGNFLLFVVDASGSMGARGRMAASKGAVMSLLLDAYQKRDRVGMISFRRSEAVVNLPPTTSVELAGKLLEEMPVGGRTPLSSGLAKAYEQLRNQLLRDPSCRPIVIFITDGKSNVALGEGKPVDEAFRLGKAMAREERVQYIVVDTEEAGLVTFGLAGKLAENMQARYFKIDDLKAKTLVDIVKEQQV